MARAVAGALAAALLLARRAAGSGGVSIGGRQFSHKWLTKRSMPEARSDMTATTVGDKIFLIGGCVMDQEWTHHPSYSYYGCGSGLASAVTGRTAAYLPLSDAYEANFSDAPRARYRHAAAAVADRIYLFGGTDGAGNIVPQVDVLDTARGVWATLTQPMPSATTDLTAFVHSGKIYVLGGYTASWTAVTATHIFDPAMSGSAAWTTGPALKQGRGDTSAAMVGSSAFIVGGFHHGNNFEAPLGDMERLDPGASGAQWTVRQAMAVARGDKAVASLHDVLHVIGGETKTTNLHSQPLKDVEVYDPVSNKWHLGGSIPSERFRFTAAAHDQSIFIFGGQGYLVGGYGTRGSRYPVLATVEEYSESVTAGSSDVSAAAARGGLLGALAAASACAAAAAAAAAS